MEKYHTNSQEICYELEEEFSYEKQKSRAVILLVVLTAEAFISLISCMAFIFGVIQYVR